MKPWLFSNISNQFVDAIEICNGPYLNPDLHFDPVDEVEGEFNRKQITIPIDSTDYPHCTLILNGLFLLEGKENDYWWDRTINKIFTTFDIGTQDKIVLRFEKEIKED